MTGNESKTFELHEADFNWSSEDAAANVHTLISGALGFPAYYGSNLSALSDCLGDICEPTRIVVKLADEESYRAYAAFRKGANTAEPRWIDRFIRVLERSARENPALEFIVFRE